MSESQNLLLRESHFAFGKNWARYASGVGLAQIEEATAALQKLVGDSLQGKRFLDIGCGSGIHALAALRLGATTVVAVDLDADSVATARSLLETHAPAGRWQVHELTVFELEPAKVGVFDVVYSWGVLHHTGDLQRALRCGAALVDHGGTFVFALYRKTACCGLWRLEKRWYASSGARAQGFARALYTGVYRLALTICGRSYSDYVANYCTKRGMDFHRDVHDWLGGWPYESISAAAVDELLRGLGFVRQRMFGRGNMSLGALGVGCNEYVYTRSAIG
jgi:SAM-dependent methyltransferase